MGIIELFYFDSRILLIEFLNVKHEMLGYRFCQDGHGNILVSFGKMCQNGIIEYLAAKENALLGCDLFASIALNIFLKLPSASSCLRSTV